MNAPTLLDQLRFALAPSHRRRQAIKDAALSAALLAFLLLAFGIVGRMDYEDALRTEAEAALDLAALNHAALVACLNGGAPGLYTLDDKGTRHYIVCSGDTWTVSDEGITNKRRAM